MNLNQAAHGDREHGFIAAAAQARKVICGHWQDEDAAPHRKLDEERRGRAFSRQLR